MTDTPEGAPAPPPGPAAVIGVLTVSADLTVTAPDDDVKDDGDG